MAEVLKYGCILDRPFFDRLVAYGGRSGIMAQIEDVLYTCCDLKRQVVLQDERDTGLRMLLNFGHTIGHAFELAGHYQDCTHGQGVAAGMVCAVQLGIQLGVTPPQALAPLEAALTAYGLPTQLPCPWDTLVEAVGLDKKRAGDQISLILLEELGRAISHKLSRDQLLALLQPIFGGN